MQDSFGPIMSDIRTQESLDAFLDRMTPADVARAFDECRRICLDAKYRQAQQRAFHRATGRRLTDEQMTEIGRFGLRGINAYRKARAA